ncbi:GtrA family protein [Novosphingobium pentaromativorans]|uniref:GtrA family protein n=1 Tax=Novosphingobium pentaromativorans TaxID=205844 RepID=UPI00069164BE|nr:GtrA family protein [Novosphingobium pentaromativorans]
MRSFFHGSGRQSGRLDGEVTHPGLRERLINRRSSLLYIKNAVASSASFLFDLLLISLMIERWGWNKLAAVAVGFVLANALHYLLARAWIFRGSLRGLGSGYVYFLGNALFGLAIILALFALLADGLGVPYLIARVIASLCAGTIVFILNATINFRQL